MIARLQPGEERAILGRLHAESRAFQDRLISALAAVTRALQRSRRPYIAFSGGKDSLAVTAIVHAVAPEVPLVWSDDELEYPESVAYIDALRAVAGPQLTITLGWAEHAGWFRPWTERPYWREPFEGAIAVDGPVDDWQADLGYDLTFLGLRMEENRRRRDWLIQTGPIYASRQGTLRRCCPLWDWTADDVWALIAAWGLPYNRVYDRLEALGVPRRSQRVGPLPLARRNDLEAGWPDLLARLEARYGPRWRR